MLYIYNIIHDLIFFYESILTARIRPRGITEPDISMKGWHGHPDGEGLV